MTVISSEKNLEDLTLTFVAEFTADVERVWQLWADPRKLERWWGPPTWPATFEAHDFVVGGTSAYYMTGPAGEKAPGWWGFLAIEPPNSHGGPGSGRLEFEDGFSGPNGEPDTSMPTTRTVVTVAADGGITRMTVTASFASAEQLEQLMAMGMEEGMRLALGQIDAVLLEAQQTD